jgi:hypothetical protein
MVYDPRVWELTASWWVERVRYGAVRQPSMHTRIELITSAAHKDPQAANIAVSTEDEDQFFPGATPTYWATTTNRIEARGHIAS